MKALLVKSENGGGAQDRYAMFYVSQTKSRDVFDEGKEGAKIQLGRRTGGSTRYAPSKYMERSGEHKCYFL